MDAVKSLKNNKSTSFDLISNEMIKNSMPVLLDPIFELFNTMINNSLYSSYWKLDILSPIHKKGLKDDPNNYRGIAVASHFGKLFNTVLKNRLQKFCDLKEIMKPEQISGKKGARTADHLTVVRFLIEKYALQGKRRLYACFFDLRKAFDTVDRVILFYKLLSKYKIGGKFLKILTEIYENNQMFIKLSRGLTHPFVTTLGVKQGCVLSPLIFNLFIIDLPDHYDDQCDPVFINDQKTHCLMFADDVMVLSQTSSGLKRAISITTKFFNNVNLSVNFDKTQVMVFNARGVQLDQDPDHHFQVGDHKLKVVNEYTYLGIKLTPSGVASHGANELFLKSRRSWFSISNMIYKHKRLPTDKAFQIFDQLVTSIGLYNCESWLPLIMTKKSFSDQSTLLKFWESFKLETLNQKIGRMILGVHKKSSRLGTIGELGRFPLFVKAICHVIKYQAQICKTDNNSLIGQMVKEIKTQPNHDLSTWWGRVDKIKQTLGIKYSSFSKIDIIGQNIKRQVKSKFEAFWLAEINEIKLGPDNKDHNKLRFYSTIKGCFKKEPYVDLVPNRAQRADLSRLRISSSRLGVEVLRYKNVPLEKRYCGYCTPSGADNNVEGYLDDEQHFLTACTSFTLKRNCFFSRLNNIITGFSDLSSLSKTATILCPTSVQTSKLSNKFIKIMFKARKSLDDGYPILNMGYERGIIPNEFFDIDDSYDSDHDLSVQFI